MGKTHAPYNFVPFGKVLARYEDISKLPAHNEINPSLKSGEIHITMTAKTPVFIAGLEKKSDDTTDFFKALNGKYAIPGSSVRGMVRANMKILGYGLAREGEDIEDAQIFYRSIAARIGSPMHALSEDYKKVLGVYGRYAPPENVKSGYLKKVGNDYAIVPTKADYLCIKRTDDKCRYFSAYEAKAVPVGYIEKNGQVTTMVPWEKKRILSEGEKRGMLLCPGQVVGANFGEGKIKGSIYLFPEADESKEIALSPEDVLRYREDIERRANTTSDFHNLWALPDEGESKPVFYVTVKNETENEDRVYFGMSRYLRIGYKQTIAKGLPDAHQIKNKENFIDYPYAILGFAGKKNSYKSRVSFENLCITKPANIKKPIQLILGQPKPSWYVGYLKGLDDNGKLKVSHYNDDKFTLRGRKQYWLKPVETQDIGTKQQNVASTLNPLPAETQFQGVIRYKNLHEDELGLLLWSLKLNEGCYQQIGMGRPMGYGRMELEIKNLYEYDFAQLYSTTGLSDGRKECSDKEKKIDGYIKAYHAHAKVLLSEQYNEPNIGDPTEDENIKDFLYIKSKCWDKGKWEVQYMNLKDYKNVNNVLPTLRYFRKNDKTNHR